MGKRIVTTILFCLIGLLAIASSCVAAEKEDLLIYYFHRPPYYIRTDGIPKGFIMAFVEKVLEKSGIKARFQELPPKRILESLKTPKNACSPGWFKTPEREELYLFSAAIYRDAPMGFVVRKPWNGSPERISLHDLKFFIKSSRNPGFICGFSYGPSINDIFSYTHVSRCITTSVVNIIKMVSLGRVDFTIVSLEEFGYIIVNHPDLRESLWVMTIQGTDNDNKRYLMCSKGISPELFERINQNILEIVSWLD